MGFKDIGSIIGASGSSRIDKSYLVIKSSRFLGHFKFQVSNILPTIFQHTYLIQGKIPGEGKYQIERIYEGLDEGHISVAVVPLNEKPIYFEECNIQVITNENIDLVGNPTDIYQIDSKALLNLVEKITLPPPAYFLRRMRMVCDELE